MITKFLLVLIYFSSYQCQALRSDSVDVLQHSEITGERSPSQRRVIVRRNAEPAVDIQSNKPEIFFCCGPNQIFHIENAIDEKCSQKNGIEKLEFPPIYTDDLKESVKDPSTHFDIRHKYPCKDKSQTMNWSPTNSDDFYILKNGTIFFDNSNYSMPNSTGNKDAYCLANMMRKNKTYSTVRVCFPAQKTQKEVPLVYPITMAVSVPLLIATFLVYVCLPKLRNIHGFTLMAYVACLCATYVSLSINQFGGSKLVEKSTLCTSLALTIHFSFLASLFWLNVMCFDVWWTFRKFYSLQGSVSQCERKKFIIYSLYSWGCAFLLTGICFIVGLVREIPDNIMELQFGKRKCWPSDFFTDNKAMAISFYGPMATTSIINICLLILTALKIRKQEDNHEELLERTESHSHNKKKQWFTLHLMLFILMNISWSMEIISWYFTDQNGKRDLNYIWIIPYLINTLQGVIIFIIFVNKDEIGRLFFRKTGEIEDSSFRSRIVIPNTIISPLEGKTDLRQTEKI